MKYLLWMVVFGPVCLLGQGVDEGYEAQFARCYTTEMQESLFESNPDLASEAEEAGAWLENLTKDFSRESSNRDGDPYVIPVVFHIVHANGNENISNAQVEDCIRVLNEDFSATNAGANNVFPLFADLVADVGIEFRLARIDPDGNCTNGIVRTVSSLTSNGGENLKTISPIWDRSKYMNVWVCRTIGLSSGGAGIVAGYTYYPSALAGSFGLTNDGIVMRADYVGAIGTSNAQRSHTMTHEVGHWINLPHLWGNSNQPGLASNCNTDDGVSDTPNTLGWTSCSINGQSCGTPDNVENYMEYAPCRKMFTLGQADRMIAALTSSVASRNSLWQPENLVATGVDLDPVLCDADFSASTRIACIGEAITFTDLSFGNIQSRMWTFEGGEPLTSDTVVPTVTYNSPGLYAVNLMVSDGDESLTEEKTSYIRILDTAAVSTPFSEGFETYTSFNGDTNDSFFTENQSGDIDWEITSSAAYSGDHSAFVNGRDNTTGSVEYLLSNTFDMDGIEGGLTLSFKYAHARRNSSSDDQLRVSISLNCGNSWSHRLVLNDSELPTVGQTVFGTFVPNGQNDWAEVVISNIGQIFLTEDFRVRFEFTSREGNNIYIDDINLFDGSLVSATSNGNDFAHEVLVFPNPAEGMAIVGFSQTGADQGNIAVFDLAGRLVKNVYAGAFAAGPQQFEFHVSDLPSGLYFVRVVMDSGKTAAKKLVVN